MKTFDINETGGMPLYLNDLRFMESVHKDAFKALLKPFAERYDVIILSGCVRSVTSGTVTVTEGWIIYQGEIMRVEEQTYTEPSTDSEYWVTNSVEIVGGSKTYFDDSPHETWKETIGLIEVGGSIPPNSLTIQNTLTYFEVITNSIVYPNWTILPSSHNEYPSAGVAARYLKDNSGIVHLSGYMTANDPLGYDVGILPVGFRPVEEFKFLHTYFLNATTTKVIRMIIQTDGVIKSIDDDLLQVTELNGWPAFRVV
jgi:hypothetical protein